MTPAERIIGKFKSARELARLLGHENHTTVQGWRERGMIPIRHAPAIIAASKSAECAEPVIPSDFMPTLEPVASSNSEVAA